MARLICLANSWKHQGHCVAGIDPDTGRWIRPVTAGTKDGTLGLERFINKEEPQLLDILEIPLGPTGPDYGFEIENRTVLPGEWRRLARAEPQDVVYYTDRRKYLLHNRQRTVQFKYLAGLPPERRYSLQLVETSQFEVTLDNNSPNRRARWKAKIKSVDGREIIEPIPITDPELNHRLNHGGAPPSNHCLVTLSLGMPYPAGSDDPRCYKLAAAVIDLGI